MLSTARIEWLLGGGGLAFKVGEPVDGRIEVACVLAADIRSEMVCEAARRLRQGNLVVESLGGGRLAISEKPADAWLPPPVVEDDEDDALEPFTTDVDAQDEGDAPESDPGFEYELFLKRRSEARACGVAL